MVSSGRGRGPSCCLTVTWVVVPRVIALADGAFMEVLVEIRGVVPVFLIVGVAEAKPKMLAERTSSFPFLLTPCIVFSRQLP